MGVGLNWHEMFTSQNNKKEGLGENYVLDFKHILWVFIQLFFTDA